MSVFNERISSHRCQLFIGQIEIEDRSDLGIGPRCLFSYNYSATKFFLYLFPVLSSCERRQKDIDKVKNLKENI